jgi:hypothetical protein
MYLPVTKTIGESVTNAKLQISYPIFNETKSMCVLNKESVLDSGDNTFDTQ